MKVLYCIAVSMLLFSFSCEKKQIEGNNAETFAQQVLQNEYKEPTLPQFSPDAIPVLLKYADNFSAIQNFPINPISSIARPDLTVGECLMWTIENIRLHYGNYNIASYPSLKPELGITPGEYIQELTEEQLKEAYALYYDWWNQNKDKSFAELRLINPLEDHFYWK